MEPTWKNGLLVPCSAILGQLNSMLARSSALHAQRTEKENQMDWIFGAFFGASLLHMGEEYFFPGGFMNFMKRLNPKFAPLVTKKMAIIVNGLQLLLCLLVIIIGRRALVFSMSLAALLFINGLIHIGGCFKAKGYAPGIITAIALYLPLSAYAYWHFTGSGQLTLIGVIFTVFLGLLFQTVPLGYFVLASTRKQA